MNSNSVSEREQILARKAHFEQLADEARIAGDHKLKASYRFKAQQASTELEYL